MGSPSADDGAEAVPALDLASDLSTAVDNNSGGKQQQPQKQQPKQQTRKGWIMASGLKALVNSAKKLAIGDSGSKATIDTLFPAVDKTVDGDDCDHDCANCVVQYPKNFKIDEDDDLFGFVKGWSTHVLVATGKTDWVRDVADEKGSVMQAIGNAKGPTNGVSCNANTALPDRQDD